MSHTTVTRKNHTWKMHQELTLTLDHIIKNQRKDWDFKELISGDGMTRTGKSTIAFQCALYQDEDFAENWKEQVIFDGSKLIETAYKIPPGKVLVYDEARKGLDSKKQMERYTKNLLDFFSECGNLNHIVIVVLPDYFELAKSVAISTSIFLINCYAYKGFNRGYFDFFNRLDKKILYIKGQKYLDYKAHKPSFDGTFIDWIPFDRKEYEELKKATLKKIRKQESISKLKEKYETDFIRLRIIIKWLIKELKFKPQLIGERLGIARTTVYNYLKVEKKEE